MWNMPPRRAHEDEVLAYSPRRASSGRLDLFGSAQRCHDLTPQGAEGFLVSTPQAFRHFRQRRARHLERPTSKDLLMLEASPNRARPMPIGRRNHSGVPEEPHNALVQTLARPPVRQAIQARLRQFMADALH